MKFRFTSLPASISAPRRLILIAASLSLLAACQPANVPAPSGPSPAASASASASPSPETSPSAPLVTPDTPQDLTLRLMADASLAGFATSAAEPFRLCLSQVRAARYRLEFWSDLPADLRASLTAAGAEFEPGSERVLTLTRATSLTELLAGIEFELRQLPSTPIKGRTSFLGPEGFVLGSVDWEADGASLKRTLTLQLKATSATVSGEGCPLIAANLEGGRTLETAGGIFNSPGGQASPSPSPVAEAATVSAPLNLSLVEQSGSSLTLQWDFPSDARSFKLYLDGNEVAANHVTPNYYRFEGLRASTNYTLGVRSVSPAGESETVTLKGTTLAAGGRSASGNFSSGGNGNTDSGDGDRIETEIQVNQSTLLNQDSVDVAADADGNYMLVWESTEGVDFDQVYARVYASDGRPLSDEFAVEPISTGFQNEPRVAASGEGEFLVVWNSLLDTESVRGRVFDTRGEAETAAFEVSDDDIFGSSLSTAGSPEGFVVAWQATADELAYARLVSRAGEPGDAEIALNPSTFGQSGTEVAMDAAGNFVVVYAVDAGNETLRLSGRRFDSDGQASGSEFQINQGSYDDLRDPAIAMDRDGDFAVVWSGYDDNFYPEIYLRRFEPDGTPLAAESVVNPATSGYQILADIAMDADGDFAVSWQDPYLDGDDYGVYVQRYRASGRRSGSEFQVNTYTSGEQRESALALDAAGQLIVGWVSEFEDGDFSGVFTRLYP